MRELTGTKTGRAKDEIGYYQAMAKDFTPIPVSADFAALQGSKRFQAPAPAPVEVEVAKAA